MVGAAGLISLDEGDHGQGREHCHECQPQTGEKKQPGRAAFNSRRRHLERRAPAGRTSRSDCRWAAIVGGDVLLIARILQVSLDDIGPLSLQSKNPVEFSTNCAVFAESETISRLAEGAVPEDILAGVHLAMAAKVNMLVKRLKLEPDVVLTGGGGEDAGLAQAISGALRLNILVPEKPRLTAAFGAACLAEEDAVMDSRKENLSWRAKD